MRIILLFISLFLLTSVATAGQVNGFIYHRFGDDRYPSTNISADIFEQQLAYLRDNGIEVISLREIAERLSAGQDLPEHAVALSVDDAFRSFADVAMPLIRKYDIPITLFVNTDAVGTAGNLDWNELSELQTEGVTLGNHTETHAYLVESRPGETYAQWQQRIRAEIDRSQAAFQEHLGVTPELFAYPYGEYSDEVVAIIRGAGFKAAFAQQSGVMHDKHDPLTLPRFPMGGPYATLTGFIDKLRMRPLIVTVQEPTNPVVAVNPPELNIRLDPSLNLAPSAFNCFVQGDNRCRIERITEKGEGWYRILADKPLTGRRNKYTLTAQVAGTWHWFSHLWINAGRSVQPE